MSSSSCRPSGVRVSSARTLNRYVPSPATVTTSEVLPIGVAKMRVRQLCRRAGPWRSSRGRRRCPAVGRLGVVAGEDREVRAAVGLRLERLHVVGSVGWYMTWMTCQPNADLTGGRMSPSLRPGARIAVLNASSTVLSAVEVRQLAAGAGRALRLRLVALRAGDGVEQARVRLELDVGRRRPVAFAAAHAGSSAGHASRRSTDRPSASTGCGGP